MLGKKLKKLVQESELSNTEIAESLGFSVNNLYNLYKKESLDSDVIKKSCELFNVPLSYFLGDDAANLNVKTINGEDFTRKYELLEKENSKLKTEISSLRTELLEAKNEIIRAKDAFIEFQNKMFQMKFSELGKRKASSSIATLSKEDLSLFALNFG